MKTRDERNPHPDTARPARTAGGLDLAPVGSLVIIRASTLDLFFAPPTALSFADGEDIEIARGIVQFP
ncbi:MAG: hypothetical protein Q8M64_10555, partial [Methyloversatilis sp.]|nr:hypothetical protein [Methyloversatilis sp.]